PDASDVLGHPLAEALFMAWNGGTVADRAALARQRPPGPVALRSRYRHMIDAAGTGVRLEPIERGLWDRALLMETEGDRALVTGDLDHAATAFDSLLREVRGHPVPTVNALIGIGDVHRARDDVDKAVAAYDAALELADKAGYRFGTVRALVPAGH